MIFNLVMDLGASRARWDLTFERGEVVERVGKYSDIVRIILRDAFTYRGRNEVCLRRTWSFDRDGSFTVALASISPSREKDGVAETRQNGGDGSRGAFFGGWIVTPFSSSSSAHASEKNDSRFVEWTSACLVTNAVKIQSRGWFEWLRGNSGGSTSSLPVKTVCAQVAGLRELCEHTSDAELDGVLLSSSDGAHGTRATRGTFSCTGSFGGSLDRVDSGGSGLRLDCENDDERFFEANSQASDEDLAFYEGTGVRSPRRSFSLSRDRDARFGETFGSLEEGRWPAETNQKGRNCWCSPDGNNFRVRDANYLRDRKKRLAGRPFADLVAVDWFVDCKRIDNVCARPTGTCRAKILNGDGEKFVFCVNIQVPGQRNHSIVYYFLLNEPLDDESVFGKFVRGDQEYRDARLKLIPHVALGPWVVQRAVGTKPLIVGKALKARYHSSPRNFLEVDIDIGSSTVANNVVRFVLGYVRTLVVDMCFLVEGKTDTELPERLIGTSRVAHLEPDAAVSPPPEE